MRREVGPHRLRHRDRSGSTLRRQAQWEGQRSPLPEVMERDDHRRAARQRRPERQQRRLHPMGVYQVWPPLLHCPPQRPQGPQVRRRPRPVSQLEAEPRGARPQFHRPRRGHRRLESSLGQPCRQ